MLEAFGPNGSLYFVESSGTTEDTHSPLASSSQISKNTMRSYLLWQGPACGRVIAVSLVAGTALKREIERVRQVEGVLGED